MLFHDSVDAKVGICRLCFSLCASIGFLHQPRNTIGEKRRDGPPYEAPKPKFRQQVRVFGRKLRIRVCSQSWRFRLRADLVLTGQVKIVLGQVHEASG